MSYNLQKNITFKAETYQYQSLMIYRKNLKKVK